MATSDKLNYLVGTKNAIKDAIVEKGVEVSENDTFRSYADKIKSIEAGGGGNTRKIYATNYSSTTPKKDDKVLIKYGIEAGTELDTEFTTGNSTSAKYVHPMIFYDYNTIICGYGEKSGARIEYIDNNWSSVGFSYSANLIKYTFEYLSGGLITYNAFDGDDATSGYLLETGGDVSVGRCKYLGSYNGIHYAYGSSSDENDVYVYDFDNKAVTTTQAINGPDVRKNAYLRGDKIFLYGSKNRATLYQNIDGVYTKYADTTTPSAEYFIAVTGLEIGDYLFSVTKPSAYYDLATTKESYLKVFQIQATTGTYSAKIVEVTVPELEWLKTTDCRVTYDIRTQVLMVGTKDGVYGYKFNRGAFTDIQLNLGLPTTTGQTYMAVMSPMFDKILVSSPYVDGIYHFPFKIFALGDDGWTIIDNKTLNYQPNSVYTGFATGNVDEEGKYEVEYLLGGKFAPEDSFG